MAALVAIEGAEREAILKEETRDEAIVAEVLIDVQGGYATQTCLDKRGDGELECCRKSLGANESRGVVSITGSRKRCHLDDWSCLCRV